MKKTITILFIALVVTLLLQAQSSEVLNYQGVLKNRDGSVRPNSEAVLTLEFVQGDDIVYSETHSITTNPSGFFALNPGNGTAVVGDFEQIDWGAGNIVMRSILDGSTIAETKLTSVPYALYAHRVKGQDDIEYKIDSIGEAQHQTALLADDLAISVSTLYKTSDSTLLVVDSLCLITSDIQADEALLKAKTDSLAHEATFFNATAYAPLVNAYHTDSSARKVVPQRLRRTGLVVTFRSDTLNWRSMQFAHSDTAQWDKSSAWSSYGYYGNLTLPYADNNSATRLQVPDEHRRQGLIISYFNNENVVNEQYIATKCDDDTWSNDSSWMQLLLTSKDIDMMKAEIARIDTLVNDVKKGMQDMSTFGAWFYVAHNELFSQTGALDYDGSEVSDLGMVHTPLIPLGESWFVTAYGNTKYPAISFYSSPDPQSRLPFAGDTLTSETWQKQTFDFSTDEIPVSAQYFSVNMVLEKKENVGLKIRNPIENFIDTSVKYNYKTLDNTFAYIGAYVGCNGKRVINSGYRHTRFIALEQNVYKIKSYGKYSQSNITPVIVYYSDASFNDVVGYDLGDVDTGGNTSREIVISQQTAPANANYFIVNWQTAQGTSSVQQGFAVNDMVYDNSERVAQLESNQSCYAGRKLVTLGDSYTTNSGNRGKHWQQWLVEWLGLTWSEEETKNGLNGYKPMGYGGAWITPNDINSMSIRCQDVRRYSPNVIVVYGGQNDQVKVDQLGSIDDEPFIPSQIVDLTNRSTVNSLEEALEYMNTAGTAIMDKMIIHINTKYNKSLYYLTDATNWQSVESWVNTKDSISFYSAYKGIVQHLCVKNPYATLYCMTLMQIDATRYDNSLGTWEELNTLRLAKNEAIKEIAQYYGVQLIDLWNKSGVTPYNSSSLYSDWIHPNQYGYRRLAECVYRSMK